MVLSKEKVLEALSGVQDPELHKDLVSLNMIQDLQVSDGKVSFKIILTTPACPLKHQIEQEAKKAVSTIPGVDFVEIIMDSIVPNDGRSRGLLDLPIRNAVAIASGKGGVGKSTIAVNFAVLLAQSGARVGLLDADIYGPNIPTMMGVSQLPPVEDNKLVPAESFGVKLMSIGFLVKPDQPLIWRGPMLHSTIRQFLTEVTWGELDYLIVDMPPGTGDAALSLAQSFPLSGGVIVTLPQKVSQEDARRALEMFRQLDVAVFGVVENMSYLELPDGTKMDIFGTGGGEKRALESEVPFLGSIPIDSSVRMGGDTGKPVVISEPDSAVSAALRNLTESLAAGISVSALERTNLIPNHLVG